MEICDFRFTLQGRYPSGTDLSAFGMTNTAVTIHGFALHAGDGINEDDFINKHDEDELSQKLETYLDNRPINPGPNHLIILDMEPSYPDPKDPTGEKQIQFSPKDLGRYNGALQADLIEAYKRRIKVARQVIRDKWPTLKLKFGLYGVVVPMGKGQENDGFLKRMKGYQRAGYLGMYDLLDYLVPVLYNRFGQSDVPLSNGGFDIAKLHGWIERVTRQAITNSEQLTRHNGEAIPLAPILYLWVKNKKSAHHLKAINSETLGLQLRILREYGSVEIIVLWSGPETQVEMGEAGLQIIDFNDFLGQVAELPLPGCT
jgi:hypothetical protein